MLFVWIVVVCLFVITLVVLLVLGRSTSRREARTETPLRRSGTHTLAYVVPDGQDAAVLRGALRHAGFNSVSDFSGGVERLLVVCDEKDRAQVRSILEHIYEAGFAGPDTHADHVRFQDEH